MTRKSITLTTPNDESLKNQVNTEEFYSKFVRAKIDKGEKSVLIIRMADSLFFSKSAC